jgi:hypothetical protein
VQIDQRLDVAIGQGFAAQHRNRDRRLLQVGLALLRGHHDLVERAGQRGIGDRLGRGFGMGQRRQGGRAAPASSMAGRRAPRSARGDRT